MSIPSNISEGSSRNSEKEYHRFLEHSLDSVFELETQLLIADAVNYGDPAARSKIIQDVLDEQKNAKLIYGLSSIDEKNQLVACS